jgi:hypothetical protein
MGGGYSWRIVQVQAGAGRSRSLPAALPALLEQLIVVLVGTYPEPHDGISPLSPSEDAVLLVHAPKTGAL